MEEALAHRDFANPVFTEEAHSFDAAISLYQQGKLSVYRFLDAYDVVQCQQLVNGTYETEAGMKGAKVEFKQFQSSDDPIFTQYLNTSPSLTKLNSNKERIFRI